MEIAPPPPFTVHDIMLFLAGELPTRDGPLLKLTQTIVLSRWTHDGKLAKDTYRIGRLENGGCLLFTAANPNLPRIERYSAISYCRSENGRDEVFRFFAGPAESVKAVDTLEEDIYCDISANLQESAIDPDSPLAMMFTIRQRVLELVTLHQPNFMLWPIERHSPPPEQPTEELRIDNVPDDSHIIGSSNDEEPDAEPAPAPKPEDC